jgi:hypothetical protein
VKIAARVIKAVTAKIPSQAVLKPSWLGQFLLEPEMYFSSKCLWIWLSFLRVSVFVECPCSQAGMRTLQPADTGGRGRKPN